MLKTNACPFCHQPILLRHGVRLPPADLAVFDLIERAGARGVLAEVAGWTLYPGKATRAAKQLVAVHVSRINDFLLPTDVRIAGGRWQPYRIAHRNSVDD